MKKFIIYITSGIAAAMTFASCDKILNKDPLDSFADANFWSSEGNVEAYANTFYNQFDGYGGSFYFPTLNDNQAANGFRDWNYADLLSYNGNWINGYAEIRRSNVLIARVEGMSVLDDETKAHWIGVAKLMRALQYYWLVRQFGDVPIIAAELKTTDPILFGERDDRDAVMDFVLQDLNDAVAGIRKSSSKTSWSKNLANAIKSEICLYEGTYCKYRSSADGQKAADVSRANSFLNECKTASKAIMDEGSFSLADKYVSNYNSIDLKSNPEMILYKHYVKDIMHHSLVDYTCTSTEQHGLTKDAFDSYLFRDGKPLGTTTLDKSDKAVKTTLKVTDAATGAEKVLDVMSVAGPMSVRDPRLSMSFDEYLGFTANDGFKRSFDDGNGGLKLPVDGHYMTSTTGYLVRKYDTPELASGYRDVAKNYTDAPIYWLSVIYLNYAEACAELGSCSKSDLDASVNKLRARVGMPAMEVNPAADPANDMGVSNLIWEIRRERRVELMYDNNFRFWDLHRWHQLDKLDGTKNPDILYGANVSGISGIDTDKTPVQNGYIYTGNRGIRSYDKKYYFYPIPTSQITLNDKLSQNPNW